MRKFNQYNAPERYRPMSGWGFYWWSVLYSIPIIGFIFLLINACDGSNLCRRSHARSYFCRVFMILIALVGIGLILYYAGTLPAVLDKIKPYIEQYLPFLMEYLPF